jgi:hypothetical protein
MPKQTGHVWVFGGEPNLVEQPQKILLSVSNWAWTSKPITASYATICPQYEKSSNKTIFYSTNAAKGQAFPLYQRASMTGKQ